MKTREVDILIVPGIHNSGPDHWQTRWEQKLPTARRVVQDKWDMPHKDQWVSRLQEAVQTAHRPVILVGHSMGTLTIAHAAPLLPPLRVKGAFFVAPPEETAMRSSLLPSSPPMPIGEANFFPPPLVLLPFPSILIASTTDPFGSLSYAMHLAHAWGSRFLEAGDAGHLNSQSGHGPWPEGLLTFARFLKELGD